MTETPVPLPTQPGRPWRPGARQLDRARRHPLVWFVGRRVAAGVVLLFVVSILVFAATNVLPGDAASAILGRTATEASKAALREELGLDRPIAQQYADWIGGVLTGDLGVSNVARGQPVWDLISTEIVNTSAIALYTMLLLVPISLGLGVLAGMRADRPTDHVVSGLTLGIIAVPEFVIGSVLVLLFAVSWHLLPAVSLLPPGQSAFTELELIALPVITLLLAGLAYMTRIVRAGVVGVLDSDYIQMARLNGAPERRILRKHVVRNALAPSVQAFALTLQWLVGGVLIVETLFSYPGLGKALVDAIQQRDLPTVQAVGLLIAAVYIVVNILADLVVVLLVPRLRTTQR
jgi:peptide/nickel transport system permease protein